MGQRPRFGVWLVALLSAPALARADAGIPMIIVVMPGALLSLPVVVVIEAIVLARTLELSFTPAARLSLWANLVTTVVGIPVTWGVLTVLEMILGPLLSPLIYGTDGSRPAAPWLELLSILWTAPWVGPTDTPWLFPVATLVMLGPFFFTSYKIEWLYLRRRLPEADLARLRHAVLRANIASYVLLAIALVAWIVYGLVSSRV